MQPLNLRIEYMNDASVNTISGYLQMVKVYPFMKVLPIGFLEMDNGNYVVFYFGRPLLKYETFPYPIYDLDNEKKSLYEKDCY